MSTYQTVPAYTSDHQEWIRRAVSVMHNVQQGKLNISGSVTLTPNSSSTVITFSNGVLSNSNILIYVPTTANASAEIGAGTIYISSKDVPAKTITLTHANNAQADRTFSYVLIG